MGIESVGSRGAIQPVHDEETAPAAAPVEKAASSAPPPAKDEVVQAEHASVFSRAEEWLESSHIESQVSGPTHAFERADHAEAGQREVFGKNEGAKTAHELTLFATGPRAIREVKVGDEQRGASLQAGFAQAGVKAVYEHDAHERTAGFEASAEIAAVRAEAHWNTQLGDGRNAVLVKTAATADLLHAAATGRSTLAAGEEGVSVKNELEARAMLADVSIFGSATFRIGDHNIGELGAKASAGYGAGLRVHLDAAVEHGSLQWSSEAGAAVGLAGSVGTSGKLNALELAAGIADGGLLGTALAAASTAEQVEAGMLNAAAAETRKGQAALAAGGHSIGAAALGLVASALTSRAEVERDFGSLLQRGSDAVVSEPAKPK